MFHGDDISWVSFFLSDEMAFPARLIDRCGRACYSLPYMLTLTGRAVKQLSGNRRNSSRTARHRIEQRHGAGNYT
jgi:hypothetical protein